MGGKVKGFGGKPRGPSAWRRGTCVKDGLSKLLSLKRRPRAFFFMASSRSRLSLLLFVEWKKNAQGRSVGAAVRPTQRASEHVRFSS